MPLTKNPYDISQMVGRLSDPLQGVNYKPLPLPKPATLTKTEQAEIAAAEAQTQAQLDIQNFLDTARSSPDWQNASWRRRKEFLDTWEKESYPAYAQERFGNDTTAANKFKHQVLQPLRSEVHAQRREAENWGNTFRNLWQSVLSSGDSLYDSAKAVELTWDIRGEKKWADKASDAAARLEQITKAKNWYNTPEEYAREYDNAAAALAEAKTKQQAKQAELAKTFEQYLAEVAITTSKEAARTKANPQRADDAKRASEILSEDPDAFVTWRQILEGSPRALANLVAQQAGNIGAAVAMTSAGTVAGGATAGPVGAAAGGYSMAALSGALLVTGNNINELAQEIMHAPAEELVHLPGYQAYTAEGYDDEKVRELVARDAIHAVYPILIGIGAVSGLFGPEAMIARASILQSMLKGTILRRVLTGASLGAVEEYVEENLEQRAQTHGWNVGTGDTRDPGEGAHVAGLTGGLVGAITGGVGGAVSKAPRPVTPAIDTTATPTEGTEAVAGLGATAVPKGTTATSYVENPNYSAEINRRLAQGTALVRDVSQQVQSLLDNNTLVTETNTQPILEALRQAESLGVSRESILNLLTDLQLRGNIPLESDVNVVREYTEQAVKRAAVQAETVSQESQQAQLEDALARVEAEHARLVGDAEQSARIEELDSLRGRIQQRLTELENGPPAPVKADTTIDPAIAYAEDLVAAGIFTHVNEALGVINDLRNRGLSDVQITAEISRKYDDQLRQTAQRETARADTSSTPAGDTTAADQSRASTQPVSQSVEATPGDSTAAEGTGTGWAEHASTGAIISDVQAALGERGTASTGADGGPGAGGRAASDQATGTGARGDARTAGERSGDARRTADARTDADTGTALDEASSLDALLQNPNVTLDGVPITEAVSNKAAELVNVGYSQEEANRLARTWGTMSLMERGAVPMTAADVADNLVKAGMPEDVVQSYTQEWQDRMDDLINMDRAEQARETAATERMATETDTNRLVQKITEPDPSLMAVTISEMRQSPADMLSPLSIFGNIDAETEFDLHYGILPPDVVINLDPTANGLFLDSASTVIGGGMEVSPVVTPPTAAEISAEIDTLLAEVNELLSSDLVPETGTVVDNADGTADVSTDVVLTPEEQAMVDMVSEIINERSGIFQEALDFGKKQAKQRQDSFTNTAYAPQWVAGRWAHFATSVRRAFMDQGAWFRTWLIERFSAANVNPESTPLVQSYQMMPQRTNAAGKILSDIAILPAVRWAQDMAGQLNVDRDVLLNDIGQFATMVHTLEMEPLFRANLERAVQDAHLMMSGPTKADTVKKAESALAAYIEWQASGGTSGERVRTFGGRTVLEAQAIMDQLITKYGEDVVWEGRQFMTNGFDATTGTLVANSQIDQKTVDSFYESAYFVALTTDAQTATGAVNEIDIFAPKAIFHREGSMSPAQNAWSALVNYASRAARSVGISEFGNQLNNAYVQLEATGTVTNTIGNGAFKYYDGLMRVEANVLGAIRHGDGSGNVNLEALNWANWVWENTDAVVRVLETDADGNTEVKTYHFLFDPTTHAKEKAALRSPFYAADVGKGAAAMTKATRGFARLYTGLRAFFPPVTAARDTLERVAYLPTKLYVREDGTTVSGTKIVPQMVGFLANPINLANLALNHLFGKSFSPYLDAMRVEFQKSGANFNMNNLLRDYKRQTVAGVEANVPANIKGMGKKAVKQVSDIIGGWGDYFYSLPGFAQYVKLRENGVGVQGSVAGVTELMNMMQSGTFSQKYLAPIMPFTNSIFQTAGNMMSALGLNLYTFGNHPNKNMIRRNAIKGWSVMVAGIAGVSMLLPMIKGSLSSEDEEDGERRLDAIPLNTLGTFIPIGKGDGSFYKWPTGFGPFQIAALVAYGVDRLNRGVITPGDLAFSIMSTLGKTLTPNSAPAFNFSDDPVAYLAQTVSPMLLQPITQVATNRTHSGSRLRYDTYDRTKRASDHFNLTTAEAWRTWAKELYKYTGVDMAPEEIRALTNGYLAGPLTAITAWIEDDPLYKSEAFQTTRDEIGPLWTALGATTVYNNKLNLSQTEFYNAKTHYETLIRRAGINLTGAPKGVTAAEHKRNVMSTAGFTQAQIDDYLSIHDTATRISKLNTEAKKQLDALLGPDMDEGTVKSVFLTWSDTVHDVQAATVKGLNFYNAEYRDRDNALDKDAIAALRGEVPGMATVPGNIDLQALPVVRGVSGDVRTLDTMIFQDRDGLQTVIPIIGTQGETLSEEQALRQYYTTKKHYGKFRSIDAATKEANVLQQKQRNMGQN